MLEQKLKEKPKEKNKPEYRGGMFDQIDLPAVTSFTACALLFVLLLVGVRSIDYSSLDKPSLEDLSDRVSKIIMPLKPLGNTAPKPKESGSSGKSRPRKASGSGAGDASASARIERSRKTVTEQIGKVQERITKAAVLSILSGKGPATAGRSVGHAGKSTGFADWGDLDQKLGKIEGLTKFDGKKGDFNQEGEQTPQSKGDAIATSTGIDKMVKGFQNAKRSSTGIIGVAGMEKPESLERSPKNTGNRSVQEVAAYISQKQSMVSMLYEERLKINPSLEGKVTVVLVIEEDGTVSSATALRSETTLDDPDFIDALLRRVKRWIFPPSSGGPVEMKSPFVFKPA